MGLMTDSNLAMSQMKNRPELLEPPTISLLRTLLCWDCNQDIHLFSNLLSRDQLLESTSPALLHPNCFFQYQQMHWCRLLILQLSLLLLHQPSKEPPSHNL
jgi:hypothetical protein